MKPTPAEAQSIDQQMAKGAVWMVTLTFLGRGLALISTMILARLLMPADFGLVAMATVIMAVTELLGQFNVDVFLIQKQSADREHYDTAWTLNVLVKSVSAVLLVLLAYPTAAFYSEPRLVPIMAFLAGGVLIQGFQNIGIVNFRKEMQFNKEFRFFLSIRLIAFAVTVPLAFFLRNYWALVAGQLVGRVAGLMLSYILHPYRPKFSLAAGRDLIRFSKWLLMNNIIFFCTQRSAVFIIGRLSGAGLLGIYSLAFELSNLPTTALSAPINRAIFPGYAKKSKSLSELRQGYLSVIGMVAMLTLPAGAGIAVLGDLLVRVILGPNWLEAIPLVKVLAFFGILAAVQTNNGYVFLSMGKPRIVTALSAAYLLVLLPLLIAVTHRWGPLGAAWGHLIAAVLMTPINYAVLMRQTLMKPAALLRVVWRPMVSTAVMYASVSLLLRTPWPDSDIARLLSCIVSGVLVFVIVDGLLWWLSGKPPGAERSLASTLRSKIGLGQATN